MVVAASFIKEGAEETPRITLITGGCWLVEMIRQSRTLNQKGIDGKEIHFIKDLEKIVMCAPIELERKVAYERAWVLPPPSSVPRSANHSPSPSMLMLKVFGEICPFAHRREEFTSACVGHQVLEVSYDQSRAAVYNLARGGSADTLRTRMGSSANPLIVMKKKNVERRGKNAAT